MRAKRGWQKRFAKSINQILQNDKSCIGYKLEALKDAVYLLGVAIDKDKYTHMGGFTEFCRELDIVFHRYKKSK